MTTTINRRHALLGTAAIPATLAPLALAQTATTAPAATLVDLERKLTIFADEDLDDEARDLDRLIADVQTLDGRAV